MSLQLHSASPWHLFVSTSLASPRELGQDHLTASKSCFSLPAVFPGIWFHSLPVRTSPRLPCIQPSSLKPRKDAWTLMMDELGHLQENRHLFGHVENSVVGPTQLLPGGHFLKGRKKLASKISTSTAGWLFSLLPQEVEQSTSMPPAGLGGVAVYC